MLKVGDLVRKLKGYTFTGEVRSVFTNMKGDTRIVVEMLNSGGLLHIFSLTDVEAIGEASDRMVGDQGIEPRHGRV